MNVLCTSRGADELTLPWSLVAVTVYSPACSGPTFSMTRTWLPSGWDISLMFLPSGLISLPSQVLGKTNKN